MTLYNLIAITPIFFLFYGIWLHTNITHIARTAVKRRCIAEGVQLLDQTIILKRMRLARSSQSLFAFMRTYRFEFSSVGDYRYQGSVTLVGKRVEEIELAPFKTIEPEILH